MDARGASSVVFEIEEFGDVKMIIRNEHNH
jgi:hypothetical protein